ncbi:MAG: carbamoyltransferase HypF [Desulfobacterales bacterium]|nr:carbamoyltransferase HypF [Desulfobacterales bacterium]
MLSGEKIEDRLRLRVVVRGAVQGVGFRPFIHRLARRIGLSGWVKNTLQGVSIEAEGTQGQLEAFLLGMQRSKPPRAFFQSLESSLLDPVGFQDFTILQSNASGDATAIVLPDIATCPDCVQEIITPGVRRYRYPFTNCTHCGPRFSIIEALPYDRGNTSMKAFQMCLACRSEYDNLSDRRFHAQPIACPACGPHLELWDFRGFSLATHDDALRATADALRSGDVVAVKGLGGFQLTVDARNDRAVQFLRAKKPREAKPLALIYPSLAAAARDCEIDDLEARLLTSPAAPIVLLRKSCGKTDVAPAVAPGNPYLGVMLPYTPLHHLLMADLGFPIVATSGNLSDEPICIDGVEALERLGGIAGLFLVHNRPIVRHVDDSIARLMMGRETVLRRARGYAPLPIRLKTPMPPLLAAGGHLKNTIAVAVGQDAVISQHIGDLETVPAHEAYQRVLADFHRLYALSPVAVACDAHPDYLSTRYAGRSGLPLVAVQHHLAHVLSCMAENELEGPVLGVAWDGAGYGLDGTLWGGEFIRVEDEQVRRVAHLRPFPLPGGDKAAKEPRRAALGMLYALYGDPVFQRHDLAPLKDFTPQELATLRGMLAQGINCPMTTSIGRLFDVVASLSDCCQHIRFEGQAAMALEFALESFATHETYHFALIHSPSPAILDFAPVIEALLQDVAAGVSAGMISAKFHHALIDAIIAVARHKNCKQVALTGGCFQNKYLTEGAVKRLQAAGFRPYWHQRVPPNDGGLALGQLVAAAHRKVWSDVSGNSR